MGAGQGDGERPEGEAPTVVAGVQAGTGHSPLRQSTARTVRQAKDDRRAQFSFFLAGSFSAWAVACASSSAVAQPKR